ncbi:MAG: hypothetical protein AB9866_25025 [Syntrophobacteraceae bacterium]
MELLLFEMQIAAKGAVAGISALNQYHTRELREVLEAFGNSIAGGSEHIMEYSERKLRIMEILNEAYPQAVREIGPEYGPHFDNGGYIKAEAEKMIRRGVAPWRAQEEACKIVENRRAHGRSNKRKSRR